MLVGVMPNIWYSSLTRLAVRLAPWSECITCGHPYLQITSFCRIFAIDIAVVSDKGNASRYLVKQHLTVSR